MLVISTSLVSCSGGDGKMDPNYSGFPDTPFTIYDESDLIGGPNAQGRIGDVLMFNDQIRVIIQKPAKNAGLNSFGGIIIDADMMGGGGDHFGAIFPLVNAEWTVNYYNYEVTEEGTEGGPKILRAYGRIDTYDYLNFSFIADVAQSLVGQQITWPRRLDDRGDPFDIYDDLKGVEPEVVTDYILEPGSRHVRIETTFRNNGDEKVYLPVGDFINGSGALETIVPGIGFAPALMTQVAGDTPGIIYAGLPGTSTSYGYFYDSSSLIDTETGERLKTTSVSFSGLTSIILGEEFLKILTPASGDTPNINFFIPAKGERTITRYFVVGDGTAQSIYEEGLRALGVPTRTVSGTVKDAAGNAVAGATVAVKKAQGGTLVTYETNSNGAFMGKLPYTNDIHAQMLGGGKYMIAVGKDGYHLNGTNNAGSCEPADADLTASDATGIVCTLGEVGTVTLAGGVVNADSGAAIPARLTIVGEDPSPEGSSVGTFRDILVYNYPFGIVDIQYVALDGTFGFTGTTSFELEPGTYLFVFSHGTEYTTHEVAVTVAAGGDVQIEGVALARVVPTPGFVSVDFHHHSVVSPDSWIPHQNRVLSAAAEGMDILLASDHDYLNDYGPYIAEVASKGKILPGSLKSIIGDEITPNHYGHFGVFPMPFNPDDPTNGALDWSASPLDEVSTAPDYVMSPKEIVDVLTGSGDRIVQINHIMDNPTGLLAATGWVTSPLYSEMGVEPLSSYADPIERRLQAAGDYQGFPLEYGASPFVVIQGIDAIELAIGYNSNSKLFMESSLPTWFNLLNLGAIMTATSNTDSHDEAENPPGLPRNFVASSVDPQDGMGTDAQAINEAEIVQAVRDHKVIISAGPYMTIDATGSDGSTKGIGDIISSQEVTLTINVMAPSWAWFDTIDIFANTEPIPIDDETDQPMTGTAANPDEFYKPYHIPRYTYQPTQRYRLADGTLTSWKEEEGVIKAELQTTIKVDEDTWVVVYVHGTKSTEGYRSLFPVAPSSLLNEDREPEYFDPTDLTSFHQDANVWAPAWALANPIFIDADGDGEFTAKFVRNGMSPLVQ